MTSVIVDCNVVERSVYGTSVTSR